MKPDAPVTGSTEEMFQYDGQGRRIEEDIYNWNGTTGQWDTTADDVLKFAYQGTNLVAELNGNNNLVTTYGWGPGGLLSVTDYTGTTPTTYVAVLDAAGNTTSLVNPTTGAVAATFTYDPYGKLLSATGPAAGGKQQQCCGGQG